MCCREQVIAGIRQISRANRIKKEGKRFADGSSFHTERGQISTADGEVRKRDALSRSLDFIKLTGHALRTLPLARDYPRVFKTFAVKAAAFAYQAALFRPAFGNGFGRGNVRNLACELRRHFEKPCIIGGRSAEDQCKAHVGA